LAAALCIAGGAWVFSEVSAAAAEPEWGFDEAMGCYTLKADGNALDFEVPVDCHWPVFQIDDWAGDAPKEVSVAGKDQVSGRDCLVHVEKGRLLLQLKGEVKAGTRVLMLR
jgi:hypothetical protein